MLGGARVAKLLSWQMEGDAVHGYVGTARVASVNTFYINHGSGFVLHLQGAGGNVKGRCQTAVLGPDGMLHFHIVKA